MASSVTAHDNCPDAPCGVCGYSIYGSSKGDRWACLRCARIPPTDARLTYVAAVPVPDLSTDVVVQSDTL